MTSLADRSSFPPSSAVADALDEYLDALQAGSAPDRAAFLARHPALAAELAPLLDGIEALHAGTRALGEDAPSLGLAGEAPPAPLPLGDFRIVCEIGRGGMGIVYEAEQLSLGRRVALKVLPFAAALDPKALRRFKAEAQAAAALHHGHIVPVFAVGSERGVHYYAMQYIEGQSLAALIAELRRAAGLPSGTVDSSGVSLLAHELASGRLAPPLSRPAASPTAGAGAPTEPVAELSTRVSSGGADFFRTAAHLGAQAADALAYAHDEGVIHRDVKPGNLLVDLRGTLFVADLGLARVAAAVELTATGEEVGTLRYMSPEQLAGRAEGVDGRADVYGLGATLYELLTLEPPFGSADRQELRRQISDDDPRPLRTLNRAVPADLETIVLTALAKDSAERYATAKDMADDLRRFLEDRTILARRATLRQRFGKWSRRHRTLVRAVTTTLLLSMTTSLALLWTAYRRTDDALRRAQANEAVALESLDEMSRMADFVLQHQPGEQQEQRAFLVRVKDIMERLADVPGATPKARHEAARAFWRVGAIERRLGDTLAAEEAYREAVRRVEPLAEAFPDERAYRFDLRTSGGTWATS